MKVNFIGKTKDEDTNELEYYQYSLKGYKIVKLFADKHDLPVAALQEMIQTMYVYHDHNQFSIDLSKMFNVKKNEILPSYVGTIVNHALFIMDKEYFLIQNPSYIGDSEYIKLIAHELAHEYHIFLLDGNENDMGPIWFYEGFATAVANQYEDQDKSYSKEKIKEVILTNDRNSYAVYRRLFEIIEINFDMAYILRAINNPHFVNRIIDLIEKEI